MTSINTFNLDVLIGILSNELMEPKPDIQGLIHQIRCMTGSSEPESKRLLYQIVNKINNNLFPPITKMELILVQGCNLACKYCFEKEVLHRTTEKKIQRMSDETIGKAITFFFDYAAENRDLSLVLFGGEPLLHFSGIKTAVSQVEFRAKQTGKTVSLDTTSNGVLLNEENTDYFAKHRVKVLLSIDGLPDVHDKYRVDRAKNGTYDRVLAGLALLKRKQGWVGAKITVMPDVVNFLFDGVKHLYNEGVNQFIIGHATGVAWDLHSTSAYRKQMELIRQWYMKHKRTDLKITEFDEDEKQPPYFGCGAGRDTIAVSFTGDITGCSRISTLHPTKEIGKLGDLDFGLYQLTARLDMVSCATLKNNCEEQGIADQYRGGCFATNYEATGNLFKPSLDDHQWSTIRA